MKNNRRSIAEYSVLIAILVSFGKVLGFIKQSVIAWGFGANGATDLYFAADGFTSTIFQVLSSSIAPTVLTSYLRIKNQNNEERAKELVSRSLLFFVFISIILIGLSSVFSDQIASLIGISYTADQRHTLSIYVVSLSISFIFASVSGVLQGYLNANNRYVPGKIVSLFYSFFTILAILVFKEEIGIVSLIVGYLVGCFLHMIFIMYCSKDVIRFSIVKPFFDDDFKNMFKIFVPLLISMSVVDFGHLVDRIIASSLEEGSISVLNYGQVLSSDLVNAVVVTTVGTVLLTSFTNSVTKGDSKKSVVSDVRNVISTMGFLTILLTALYYVEGSDLVEVLLQRGSFNASNASRVSAVAFFYAQGFLFMALREILIKVHYAYLDMKDPVINSAVGVLTNLVLSITLSRVMGVSGIALATSISLMVVSVLSIVTLKKHIDTNILDRDTCFDVLKIIVCGLVASGIGAIIRIIFVEISSEIRMIIVGTVICIVYFIMGIVVHERSAIKYRKYASGLLRRRF